MKSIIALSDNHYFPIPDRLMNIIDESDYVFFLGDGTNSLGNLVFHDGFYGVKGNCDSSPLLSEQVVEIEGFKILLTHGDKYNVKRDLTALKLRAQELGCQVVFYGHTHFAEIDREDNITLICPGSTHKPLSGTPTYCYATISGGKFLAKIVKMP